MQTINDLTKKVVDVEMNGIVEKIDAEIICIKKVLVSGTFTEEVYGTLMGKLQMAERIKAIILAEQKEPCHGCKHKGKTIDQYPCNMCPRIYTDKFTPINQPQEGE